MDNEHPEQEIRRIPKIKKFLFIEDGSVDIDELREKLNNNPESAVVVCRQGSVPPELVENK